VRISRIEPAAPSTTRRREEGLVSGTDAGDGEKWWYNLRTGQVEFGMASPSIERAGPFETAEAAAAAPEVFRERSRAWAEEEAREDSWGASSATDE
jgi:hypothetical protein